MAGGQGNHEAAPRSRRGRITLLVFLLALSLLALVVLRAYQAHQLDLLVAEVPLLRADPSPTRERPAVPGGSKRENLTLSNHSLGSPPGTFCTRTLHSQPASLGSGKSLR